MKLLSYSMLLASTALPFSALAQSAAAPASPSGEDVAPASAQSSPAQSPDGVGDIVVTAQKRAERLQDVPLSITAASSAELKSRGIASTDDLVKLASGFAAAKSSFGIPIYFIRGVGFVDDSLGISPAVMTYVDQIPLDYAPMGRGAVLDLERVEILKGPQGTLFGVNTTGGAVNYISAKPTDKFEAGIEGTYARFNEVAVEGFVSGPLGNNLSARLAVRSERSDGWQKGYAENQGYSRTARLGAKRFLNARLLVDWAPTATTKVELMATGWRDRSDTQAPQLLGVTLNRLPENGGITNPFPVITVPAPPKDNRAAGFDVGGDFRQRNSLYQFGVRIDQELGDRATLTSLTSYARFKRDAPIDADGTVYPSEIVTNLGDVTTFNQELRVEGRVASFLSLTVGGNYTYNKVSESQNFYSHYSSNVLGPISYEYFGLDNNQRVNTYSGFASSDIKLTDSVSAQLGLRYTSQDRTFAGCSRDLGAGDIAQGFSFLSELLTGEPASIAPGSCITLDGETLRPTNGYIRSSLNQNNLSWRANLSWEPTRDLHLYANVTKGYKSGSFPTLTAPISASLAPVKQESLLAYEIGAKASLLDRRVQLSGAAFYYDYSNKQLVGFRDIFPFGPLATLVNIPKSKIEGVELNVDLRPVEGLTINFGGSYLNTKIQTDPALPTGPFGNVGSFIGNQFPFTSKWQGTLDAQYRFAVNRDFQTYFGGTVTARTKAPSSLYTGTPAVDTLEQSLNVPGYALVDLRLGLAPSTEAWNLEFFARNIFNKYYATSAGKYIDYRFLYTGAPPSYGVTFRYRFD